MKLFTYLTLAALMWAPAMLFSQTTYIDNGTSNSYTLQSGDSLYIRQGTFTGSITNWGGNGKVTVAEGATLRPSSVNGLRGRYVVYGTAIFNAFNTEAGFGLNNFGSITINNGSQVNGNSAQAWVNNTGATLTFRNSFAINANSVSFTNNGNLTIENAFTINGNNTNFYNTGTVIMRSSFAISGNNSNLTNNGDITTASDFNFYANSTLLNNKSLVISGDFNSSRGDITNGGLLSAQRITFSGNTNYTNSCRTVAANGLVINSNSTTVYNNGLLWASNSRNASSFTNSGTIISSGRGVIKAVTFINYRYITGNGFLYITGRSTLSNQARIGTNGNTQDSLKVYTVNRTNVNQIFDDQWGTVYNNTRYAQFPAPDTTTASYYPCSVQYAPLIILPVVWNGFSVSLSANIPALTWNAKYDAGTYFEVERSNNGIDFVSIAKMAGLQNASAYSYNDRSLPSAHPSVVYYRIKATEPDGKNKYTDVKSVRFSNEGNHSVQAWPNPFSSQLTINYKATQKATLTIKIYNVDGQVQVVKTVAVNNGNNTIAIVEANRLTKGIYIVRISTDNGVTASSKIIKQ